MASDAKWIAAGFDMAADIAVALGQHTMSVYYRNCALELRSTGRCQMYAVYMKGPTPEAQAQPDKAQGA
jgi:hypothetical protein